jgi:uncharacterized membrane protein
MDFSGAFFFISSVLFTKLHARLLNRNKSSISRNAWQVMANILWAVLASVLYLITYNEIFIYFFISLLAAVTADTWASEIGPVLNRKSFSIADMKMHPAGVTGGISAGGTIAAMAGSVFISSIAPIIYFLANSGQEQLSYYLFQDFLHVSPILSWELLQKKKLPGWNFSGIMTNSSLPMTL